jgi:hypothetical protein
MKKLIAIALFALPFTTLKAQDQTNNEVKRGTIETVYSDGSATLVDNNTGQSFKIVGRALEASNRKIVGRALEASNFILEIGTPVGYIEIQTGAGAKPVVIAIIDDLNGLIR